MTQKFTAVFLCLIALTLLCKGSRAEALFRFELSEIHPVSGRQGVCTQAGFYWISGSGTLAKYDENWNLLLGNKNPFEGFTLEVNHIGDIDVYQNELYVGAEYFIPNYSRIITDTKKAC